MHFQAEHIKEKLKEVGGIPEEIDEVFSGLTHPFEGLDTEYLQTKYFREKFRLLVS